MTYWKRTPSLVPRITLTTWSAMPGWPFFVDDDVEATNFTEALHSAMTKTHPARGVQIFGLAPGHPLVPFLDLHDKMHARGAAMTLDATTAPEAGHNMALPTRMSFNCAYSDDVKAGVLQGWESKYGLPSDGGRWR